jgi:hypothetical protein
MDAHELLALWPAAPDAVEPECGDMLAAWPDDPTATPESAIPAAWGDATVQDHAPGVTIRSGRHSTTSAVVVPDPAAAPALVAAPPPVAVAPDIAEPPLTVVTNGGEPVAGVVALVPDLVAAPAAIERDEVVLAEDIPVPVVEEAVARAVSDDEVLPVEVSAEPAAAPDATSVAEDHGASAVEAPVSITASAATDVSTTVAALAETALGPVETAQVAMLERWLSAIQAARDSQATQPTR